MLSVCINTHVSVCCALGLGEEKKQVLDSLGPTRHILWLLRMTPIQSTTCPKHMHRKTRDPQNWEPNPTYIFVLWFKRISNCCCTFAMWMLRCTLYPRSTMFPSQSFYRPMIPWASSSLLFFFFFLFCLRFPPLCSPMFVLLSTPLLEVQKPWESQLHDLVHEECKISGICNPYGDYHNLIWSLPPFKQWLPPTYG